MRKGSADKEDKDGTVAIMALLILFFLAIVGLAIYGTLNLAGVI